MKVNIPPGSDIFAVKEINHAEKLIMSQGLAQHVKSLTLDSKYNVCSVEFNPGTTDKGKNAVYECIHQCVSTYESEDGITCCGLPREAVNLDNDSDESDESDEGPCFACKGTFLDAEGDVCTECSGHQ